MVVGVSVCVIIHKEFLQTHAMTQYKKHQRKNLSSHMVLQGVPSQIGKTFKSTFFHSFYHAQRPVAFKIVTSLEFTSYLLQLYQNFCIFSQVFHSPVCLFYRIYHLTKRQKKI